MPSTKSTACPQIEMPLLNLALVGFSAPQVSQVQVWLQEHCNEIDTSAIQWKITGVESADALIKAQALPFDRTGPKVFTSIFWPSRAVQQQESLAQSRERFFQALTDLDIPMQPNALRYVLASQLVERHIAKEELKGLWHIQSTDTLLAVVDFDRLQAAIRPDAHYLELDKAHWASRSAHAFAPEHFQSMSIERLMWDYARRSDRNILPERYSQRMITLRRYPRLSLTAMSEIELALLTLLRDKPYTLAQLCIKLSMTSDRVSQLLGALYFSGAITTRKLSMWARISDSLRPSVSTPFGHTQTSLPQSEPAYDGPSSILLGQTPNLTRRDV
jgi:hypothetical protein